MKTTRITKKEGVALVLLAQIISQTNQVYFTQVDILTEDGNPLSAGRSHAWEKDLTEVEKKVPALMAEADFIKIRAQYTHFNGKECLTGVVEAKMRIFRTTGNQWKLHYIMYMFPHLRGAGGLPRMLVVNRFADSDSENRKSWEPGKIFSSYEGFRVGHQPSFDEGLFLERSKSLFYELYPETR